MAIKDGLRPSTSETPNPDSGGSSDVTKKTPAPYFGRTARVVADWESVDASDTPHEKNKRGELGKPLFNWYFNRTGPDALSRIAFPQSSADRRNTLQNAVARSPKGSVNPQADQAIESASPTELSLHIKKVAEHFGANVIGIAAVHPSMIYSGDRYPEDGTGSDGRPRGEGSPEAMAEKYPYAICLSTAWDYNMIQAHRHHIGDHAYHFSQARLALVYANVAAYIREMGYEAIQNRVQPMPAGLAAGVGELGRNGMLITEKYGARIHLGDPILTNMPLVAGKPIDIGVDDFCKVCRKCATTCPTNSISMEDKVVHNGVEKYKINWEQCYRLRAYVSEFWETCLTCVTVCPYTKPKVWWHDLSVQTLKRTPLSLRFLTVRGLKLIDDVFWGTVRNKRVKWVGYDSGIIPIKKKKNAAANGKADTDANGHGELPDADSKIGHYYPMKENTRRFEIMKERAEKAGRSK